MYGYCKYAVKIKLLTVDQSSVMKIMKNNNNNNCVVIIALMLKRSRLLLL